MLDVLAKQLGDHLEIVPSIAGLRVTALARRASTEEIRAVVQRASEAGVEVMPLSIFRAAPRGRAGIVLGYGAIPTEKSKGARGACGDVFGDAPGG